MSKIAKVSKCKGKKILYRLKMRLNNTKKIFFRLSIKKIVYVKKTTKAENEALNNAFFVATTENDTKQMFSGEMSMCCEYCKAVTSRCVAMSKM